MLFFSKRFPIKATFASTSTHSMASVAAMIRVTGLNCMHKLPINIRKLLHALFANLDDTMLEGKTMCRIKNEHKDMNGRNVSGHFVVQGVIQAQHHCGRGSSGVIGWQSGVRPSMAE